MKAMIIGLGVALTVAAAALRSSPPNNGADDAREVANGTPLAPEQQHPRIARLVAEMLPREHLKRLPLGADVSLQTLENFLRGLDFERVYFLQSDIERFEKQALTLTERLSEGDVAFAYEVFETFKARVQDRAEFINRRLGEPFDLTTDETYFWKRREAPWPADKADWDELWNRRLKNEYLRRVINESLEADDEHGDDGDGIAPNDDPDDAPDPPDGDVAEADAGDADDADADAVYVEVFDSPEAFIRNRYQQYLNTINSSDSDWVLQKYLTAFTQAYDPHCDYLSPASEEDFEIEMKLSLVGIGALLRAEDGAARIVRIIPGGPAAQDKRDKRLRPGDRIVAVAQEGEEPVSVLHWPLYRTVRLIRGERGTTVTLTVIPASDRTGTTTKTVDLVRDEVKLDAREAKSRIRTLEREDRDLTLGVIELPAFYADLQGRRINPDYKSSSRDVGRILRELREQDVDGIILDLRNNGGGALLESVLMTGLFIKTGPVVQVRERRGITILPDNDPAIAYSGPLVVLVNRLSASASEILAGALQDYGRAVIVGDTKTHGKGTVQTIIPLTRARTMGSMKVTSALFYRISGGATQLRGVEPDIVVPSAYEFMEVGEEFLPNALEWTQVDEAIYSPFGDLSPLIPDLRERSEQRRATDPHFQAYAELLKRVESMNATESLSLNLAERQRNASEERELYEAQNRFMEQTTGEPHDEDDTPDMVLQETLEILADLVTLSDT